MFKWEADSLRGLAPWRTALGLLAGTILAGFMVLFVPSVAAAATYTVNDTADDASASRQANCVTGSAGCTLRAAIIKANSTPAADTIVFAVSTNGSPFTLSLTGSEAVSGDAAINDLDVFQDLTITGNGPANTIIQAGASAAAGIDRVFELGVVGTVKVDVAMSGLTIRHGKSNNGFGGGISFWGCSDYPTCDGANQGTLTLDNVHVVNNLEQSAGLNGFGGGGGILIEQAHLTISNSTISNNEATVGWGGGIAVVGNDSTLDISNSTISNNQAPAKMGGGIFYLRDGAAAETFTITGSTISGNSAGGRGGGLYVELRNNTHLTITDTTVSGNSSTQSGANSGGGGGIWTSVPTGFQTTLERVTISGNTVGNGADTQFGGGGMHHGGGTLTLKNVTISGNRSAFRGGGLVLSDNGQTATLTNVTITDNHSDNNNSGGETGGGLYVDEANGVVTTTTVLHNTIVAQNYRGSGTGTADDGAGAGAISAASSYNLFGTGGSGTLSDGTGNQYNVADPRLGPLADNGGSTQTHALQIGSPALDAGGAVAGLPSTDQRGAPRSMDAAEDSDGDATDEEDATDEPDVGAYEAHPTIEDQVDLTIPEDTTPHNVAIGIGDPSHAANENITATSSNTALIASPGTINLGPAPGPTVTFNLTPGANLFGTSTITVTFTDTVPVIGGSRTETDTFIVTVTPVADPPTVSGTTTDEDVMLTSVISRNAVDGAEVTHATFSSITGGTLYESDGSTAITPGAFYALDGSGDATVKFLPDPDANSQEGDTFSFTVQAATSNTGDGISDPVTANITVNQVNDPPTADDESDATDEDMPVDILVSDLMIGDSVGPLNEQDDQTLTFTLNTASATNGTVSESGGTVTLTPDPNYFGAASFTYTVTDNGVSGPGAGTADPKSATATVTITVNPVNDPPVAADDDIADIAEDSGTYNISGATLTGNDSPGPLETDPLTVTAVSNVTGGSASVISGNVEFDPDADYFGAASFDYTVSDGFLTDEGHVTFDITPVNDPPVAVDDSLAAVAEDSPAFTVSGASLAANDSFGPANELQTLTVTGVSSPTGGTVSYDSGTDTVTFTPAPDFFGPAGFTYTVSDGEDTDTGDVTFTITAVNDPPTAVDDDIADIAEDSGTYVILGGTLTGNDSPGPLETDPLTITAVSNASGGTASVAGGNVEFIPDPDYFGDASFDYTVSDGELTDEGQVTFDITPVNDPPVAVDDTLPEVAEDSPAFTVAGADLAVNDIPGPGNETENLTVTAVSGAVGGTVALDSGTDTITFTPAPNFSGGAGFTYTVSDGTDEDMGDVTFTITAVNDPPVAADDVIGGIAEDSGTYTIPGGTLTGNDAAGPGESDTLTVTAVDNVSGGSASVAGGNVEFIPDADYFGPAGFDYTVSDGELTDEGHVTFDITPVADTPSAPSTSTFVNTPVTVTVTRNPADGAEVSHIQVTNIANGTLSGVSSGDFLAFDGAGEVSLTFTPDLDSIATGAFDVQASIGNTAAGLGGDAVHVTITVNAPDLYVQKSDGGMDAAPGTTLVYTLTYGNSGNLGATGVVLTESVPANTTFDSGASTPGWSCAGSACTLALGSLGAGASGSASFGVLVDAVVPAGLDQISNTAGIDDDGANGPDSDPGNNSDTLTTDVDAAPDLQISKDDGVLVAPPGSAISYTLTYANAGNQDATGGVITETVPANTTYTGSGWSCAGTGAGSTCTLAIGALAGGGAGGSVTFAVTVASPLPPGVLEITNTASITDDGANGADPNPGDNSATETTPAQSPTTTAVDDAAGEYSDPVTLTATVTADVPIPGQDVEGDVEFFVNGSSVGTAAIDAGGVATFSYTIDLAAGSYTITAEFTSSNPAYMDSSGFGTLAVDEEDVTVAADAAYEQVASPGGDTGTFTIDATITPEADGTPGDLNLADVTFTFVAVGPGSAPSCSSITRSVSGGVLTATCELTGVAVNVYDVTITVDGGYYEGSGETVLTVYDPSLGFVTGGGTVTLDGYDANFGANVKYLKNGRPQGSFLFIWHGPDGDVVLKSNAMQGLSIIDNQGIIQGKATLNEVGNYTFRAVLIDNGEPGSADTIALQVWDPDGNLVADMTFTATNLDGGNIHVPQPQSKGKE